MKIKNTILSILFTLALGFAFTACNTSDPIEGMEIELDQEANNDYDEPDDFGERPGGQN